MWVYETHESEEKERPVCRSLKALDEINIAEKDMREAISSLDFHKVDKAFIHICNEKIDIDARLMHEAEEMHLKLDRELDIRTFISQVQHNDSYKTIRKSVQTLEDKVAKAKGEGINLDNKLMQEVNLTC